MPQLRIEDYFQSNTMQIKYAICGKEGDSGNSYFMPGEGVVQFTYDTKCLSDNSVLITELENIRNLLKNAEQNDRTWSGVDGVRVEQLELYGAFASFCHLIWDEDVSKTEPLVYEYMRRVALGDNATVHKVCWYFID